MISLIFSILLCLTSQVEREVNSDLPRLLRKTESIPTQESGTIFNALVLAPNEGRMKPEESSQRMEYRYFVDHDNYLLRTKDTTNLITVESRNESYAFRMNLWPAGTRWMVTGAFPTENAGLNSRTLWQHIGKYFLVTNSVNSTSFADLMEYPKYSVTKELIKPGIWFVKGVSKEEEALGLREFSAMIRISQSNKYAFIESSEAISYFKNTRQKWMTKVEVINNVTEEPDRPRLNQTVTREHEIQAHIHRVWEELTTLESTPVVSDSQRKELFFTFYNLEEPVFTEEQSTVTEPMLSKDNMVLVFVALIVVGFLVRHFANRARRNG